MVALQGDGVGEFSPLQVIGIVGPNRDGVPRKVVQAHRRAEERCYGVGWALVEEERWSAPGDAVPGDAAGLDGELASEGDPRIVDCGPDERAGDGIARDV